jgi:hypothetical protein
MLKILSQTKVDWGNMDRVIRESAYPNRDMQGTDVTEPLSEIAVLTPKQSSFLIIPPNKGDSFKHKSTERLRAGTGMQSVTPVNKTKISKRFTREASVKIETNESRLSIDSNANTTRKLHFVKGASTIQHDLSPSKSAGGKNFKEYRIGSPEDCVPQIIDV